jgi:tocopherol cyclase
VKIYSPQLFQGSLNRNRYFEGWYFKHVSFSRGHVYSFIPGVSLTKTDKHAFIQVIDGISGKTWNVKYPLSDFSYSKKEFNVSVGKSTLSEKGIRLNINTEDLKINGEVYYADLVKYPSTLLSPGIMGWYSFVPFMECKHGIGSVLHSLNGSLSINNAEIDFNEGTGYIEKDWGTSFPESWIWLHCNTFNQTGSSFTFSVAKIPWLGSFFIGHICYLYAEGKFHLFATYNGSKITKLTFQTPVLKIELKNKTHTLKVKAVQNKSGELKAPVIGEMNRIIKESVDSTIEVELFNNENKIIFSDKGTRAGLEIIEKILNYF